MSYAFKNRAATWNCFWNKADTQGWNTRIFEDAKRKQRKNTNKEKHHKRRDTGEDLSNISSRIARLSPFVAREDEAAPDSTTNWRSLVALSSDNFPWNHWRPKLRPSATRRRHVLAMVAESVIRKWQSLLAIQHDHSLQPQSEKQNIKRVYRIFASCARFLYVKHARETLSLETLVICQCNTLSDACAHMEVHVAHHCFTSTEEMKNPSCVAKLNPKDITQNTLLACSSARHTLHDRRQRAPSSG